MKAPLLLAVLLLAGCAPAGPPPAPSVGTGAGLSVPADEASCRRAGGAMKRVGRMQSLQCVLAYADAGKSCTSGSQCAGECLAQPGSDPVPGQPIAGFCQATSDRFGCSTRVEDGRAQSTICID